MARTSFANADSVFDILDQVGYVFLLGTVPGAGTDNIALKCANVTSYGYGNEKYEMSVAGWTLSYRGRKTYPRTLSVTYYEDMQMGTSRLLKAWHEFIAGSESGNSQDYKSGYSISPVLYIYDTVGNQIDAVRYHNLFIQDVQDFTMEGGASGAVQIQAQFSYDRASSIFQPLL